MDLLLSTKEHAIIKANVHVEKVGERCVYNDGEQTEALGRAWPQTGGADVSSQPVMLA